MANVITVVSRFITVFFTKGGINSSNSAISILCNVIQRRPYLLVGVILLIIGFSVSAIKRLIHM